MRHRFFQSQLFATLTAWLYLWSLLAPTALAFHSGADTRGLLDRTDFADGTCESTTFDDHGRRTSEPRHGGSVEMDWRAKVGQPEGAMPWAGSAQTDQSGHTKRLSYGGLGRLTSVTQPPALSSQPFVTAFSPLNRLPQMLVSAVPATGPPTTLASYTYTLSPTCRRDAVSESLNPQPSTLNRSVSYTYDALDRLTRETITGPTGQVNYSYDAVGNRLSRTSTVPGLPSQSFGYDPNDRLLSDSYDANGNTTVGRVSQPVLSQIPVPTPPETTVTDSYDFEDRLKSRTGGGSPGVQILYDGDGHRVAETIAGQTVTYLIDDLNPTGYAQIVEERTNGTVTRTYTYGHDLLSQDTRHASGAWSAAYFGYDGHGSVRFLTDELGAVIDTYTYDAFGTLLASTGSTPNRYRYAGEEFVPSLGLYHLRARFMNAANGRFWNADTYEGTQADPQSLHKYGYAYGNPANLSDPSGHNPTLAALMINMAHSVHNFSQDAQKARKADGSWDANRLANLSSAFTANQVSGLFGFNPVSDLMALWDGAQQAWQIWKMIEAFGKGDPEQLFYALAASKMREGYSRTWAEDEAFQAIFGDINAAVGDEDFESEYAESADDLTCFVAGTAVHSESGLKPIEEIKVGERVWAWNVLSGEDELRTVARLFQWQRESTLVLEFYDDRIETTAEHPFWVEGRAWVCASDLEPGDIVRTREGSGMELIAAFVSSEPKFVYNFEVDGLHSYFVGETGILVHNPQLHHFFLRAFGNTLRHGAKQLTPLFKQTHRALHRQLRQFLANSPKFSKQVGGETVTLAQGLTKGKAFILRHWSKQERIDARQAFYGQMKDPRMVQLFRKELQFIKANGYLPK